MPALPARYMPAAKPHGDDDPVLSTISGRPLRTATHASARQAAVQ